MKDLFEKAIRLKVRFPFKGWCSVEDLWDLSLRDLDNIFKVLNRQAKVQEEESLLDTRSEADDILDLQLDIVRYVVEVRLKEMEAQKNQAERAARKQKLLSLIEEKQEENLRDMSLEELQELVDNI